MNDFDTTASITAWISGPQGSGKSTVGRELVERMNANRTANSREFGYLDADWFHDVVARKRMTQGQPVALRAELGEYRRSWLDRVIGACRAEHLRGRHAVVACSLLTRAMRATAVDSAAAFTFDDALRVDNEPNRGESKVFWLEVSEASLRSRVAQRGQHVAGPDMLASQIEASEMPTNVELPHVEVTTAQGTVEETVREIQRLLEQLLAISG